MGGARSSLSLSMLAQPSSPEECGLLKLNGDERARWGMGTDKDGLNKMTPFLSPPLLYLSPPQAGVLVHWGAVSCLGS